MSDPIRRGPLGGMSTTRVKSQLAPAATLTQMEWKFVENFLVTLDPRQSATAAGYQKPEFGYALQKKPAVAEAIQQAQAFRSARTAARVDQVLLRWVEQMTTDVNELVELRMVNCRYCWGIDGRFQYTPEEYRNARQKWMLAQMKFPSKDRKPFDDRGGYEFNGNRGPNPECTESPCFGNGIIDPVWKDTRFLSPGARMLYDGVEVSKDGAVKLKIRDRQFAETMVAKHLGMLRDREVVKTFDTSKMGVDDLDAVIENLPPQIKQQIEALFENYQDGDRVLATTIDEDWSPPTRTRRKRAILDDE